MKSTRPNQNGREHTQCQPEVCQRQIHHQHELSPPPYDHLYGSNQVSNETPPQYYNQNRQNQLAEEGYQAHYDNQPVYGQNQHTYDYQAATYYQPVTDDLVTSVQDSVVVTNLPRTRRTDYCEVKYIESW